MLRSKKSDPFEVIAAKPKTVTTTKDGINYSNITDMVLMAQHKNKNYRPSQLRLKDQKVVTTTVGHSVVNCPMLYCIRRNKYFPKSDYDDLEGNLSGHSVSEYYLQQNSPRFFRKYTSKPFRKRSVVRWDGNLTEITEAQQERERLSNLHPRELRTTSKFKTIEPTKTRCYLGMSMTATNDD